MVDLVAARRERVRLLYVSRESQILSVLLGQKSPHFDSLICLEEVELVHVRALEVRSSHMVLILITDIEDALICLEKILTLIEWIQVLLELVIRVQWCIRYGHGCLLHLIKRIMLLLLGGAALRDVE